jgi:nucleotide-binding universal stress UspA family protein
MTIKVILVPVTATETAAGTLKTAFALGRRFEAHVAALHVRADPRNAMPYMGEGMSGLVLQEIMAAADRDAAERAKTARALFDQVAAESGVPIVDVPRIPAQFSAAWREEIGREDEVVARRARLADVVVVGAQPARQSAAVGMMMEAALLESGRAVLVSPPQPAASFGGSVAVAWNGSAEASRAVAAAMPFLNAAERIAILAVGEGGEADASAGSLKQYLAWHGLEAEAAAVRPGPEGIGPAILAEAKRRGCDLLVMGAYTHNRFRQMIFGGVTRHILSEADLPVLVAH